MENLNIKKIKKKIKYLSKDLKSNYFELLDLYKKLITYYYYNKLESLHDI
jgi:hypothetical protein